MRRAVWAAIGSIGVARAGWPYAQDIDKHASCKYCGMDCKMFAHCRMLGSTRYKAKRLQNGG